MRDEEARGAWWGVGGGSDLTCSKARHDNRDSRRHRLWSDPLPLSRGSLGPGPLALCAPGRYPGRPHGARLPRRAAVVARPRPRRPLPGPAPHDAAAARPQRRRHARKAAPSVVCCRGFSHGIKRWRWQAIAICQGPGHCRWALVSRFVQRVVSAGYTTCAVRACPNMHACPALPAQHITPGS